MILDRKFVGPIIGKAKGRTNSLQAQRNLDLVGNSNLLDPGTKKFFVLSRYDIGKSLEHYSVSFDEIENASISTSFGVQSERQ